MMCADYVREVVGSTLVHGFAIFGGVRFFWWVISRFVAPAVTRWMFGIKNAAVGRDE